MDVPSSNTYVGILGHVEVDPDLDFAKMIASSQLWRFSYVLDIVSPRMFA